MKSAEAAVVNFWRVIDRLSADPKSKLEDLTSVSRGRVAAQWRQNIKDYRFERVKQIGHVKVINPVGRRSGKAGLYEVKSCIDVGGAKLVDGKGRPVAVGKGPSRVTYRYVVQEDAAKWYVLEEKVTGTC